MPAKKKKKKKSRETLQDDKICRKVGRAIFFCNRIADSKLKFIIPSYFFNAKLL